MRKGVLVFFAIFAFCALAYGGPEAFSGKEMKQVAPAPCPEWYADNEWNASLWGTYAFTENNDQRNPGKPDVETIGFGTNDNGTVENLSAFFSGDRYLETDHAWGGGVDLKYFFHRYFGIGIEGFVLDAKRHGLDVVINGFGEDMFSVHETHDHRAVGAALGTLTLRYPLHCSRFSPYVFAAAGAIFGGGEEDVLVGNIQTGTGVTQHTGTSTEGMAQFGGGLEVRITPHVGWIADFSWNVVDGPQTNFGMVRTGVNFAF